MFSASFDPLCVAYSKRTVEGRTNTAAALRHGLLQSTQAFVQHHLSGVQPAVTSCKVHLDVFQIVVSLVKRQAFGDRRAARGHVGFDESLYGSVKRPDGTEEVEACSLQLDNETGNVARRVGEGIAVQVE